LKGIIFNLLEEVVISQHGEAAWDDLLDTTGLAGSYTSLGSYPDREIEKLIAAGAEALGMSPEGVLCWFGREAMARLAVRYPAFFTGHNTTLPFVQSVNSIIHPEVRKLYSGADCPDFRFEHKPDGALQMTYDSPRKLCGLAQGFIEGTGDYFKETIDVEHLNCMHKGDPKCVLSIRVTGTVAADAA
jgi:hypothetical protein